MAKIIVGTAVGTLIGFATGVIAGTGLTGLILAKDEERGVDMVRKWSKAYQEAINKK